MKTGDYYLKIPYNFNINNNIKSYRFKTIPLDYKPVIIQNFFEYLLFSVNSKFRNQIYNRFIKLNSRYSSIINRISKVITKYLDVDSIFIL